MSFDPALLLRNLMGQRGDTSNKIAALPAVPLDATPSEQAFLTAVKEKLEVADGDRGDPLDAHISWRDLADVGMIKIEVNTGAGGDAGHGFTIAPVQDEDALNLAPPPAPTGVVVNGAILNNIVQWDTPTYSHHAHAEVWAADTDDRALAVMVGTSAGAMFVHYVGPGAQRFYWVRFVSKAGIAGDFQGPDGVSGQTSQDPQWMIEQLAGALTAEALSDVFIVEKSVFAVVAPNREPGALASVPIAVLTVPQTINGVEFLPGVYIDGASINTGTIGSAAIGNAAIDSAHIAEAAIDTAHINDAAITTAKIGSAQIDTAHIKAAAIKAAAIDAAQIETAHIATAAITNAKIGDAAVTTAKIGDGEITNVKIGNLIQSNNFETGVAGWMVDKSGVAEFQNATVRGTVYAETGYFNGTVSAASVEAALGNVEMFYFTTAGSYTLNIPAGKNADTVRFRIVGGSGGGGGGGGGYWDTGGGGGGGGGAGAPVTYDVAYDGQAMTFTVIVGSGGAGGGGGVTEHDMDWANSGGAGTAGGASSVSGVGAATGGSGGGGGASSTYGGGGGAGGALGGQAGTSNSGAGYASGGAGGGSGGGGGYGGRARNPLGGENGYVCNGGAGSAGGAGRVEVTLFKGVAVVRTGTYQNLISWLDTLGHGAVPENARL